MIIDLSTLAFLHLTSHSLLTILKYQDKDRESKFSDILIQWTFFMLCNHLQDLVLTVLSFFPFGFLFFYAFQIQVLIPNNHWLPILNSYLSCLYYPELLAYFSRLYQNMLLYLFQFWLILYDHPNKYRMSIQVESIKQVIKEQKQQNKQHNQQSNQHLRQATTVEIQKLMEVNQTMKVECQCYLKLNKNEISTQLVECLVEYDQADVSITILIAKTNKQIIKKKLKNIGLSNSITNVIQLVFGDNIGENDKMYENTEILRVKLKNKLQVADWYHPISKYIDKIQKKTK